MHRSSISARSSTGARQRSRSWRATARSSSALREALAGQRDVRSWVHRFVFQSEVLFPSGSAALQPSGEKQLASVAQRLIEISAKIPKDINWVLQVDGHTDNKPINTSAFPSNWELSAARAIAVVKFLHEQGIANEHLVAAGYGEYQPLSLMDTARNRRIELKLTNRERQPSAAALDASQS
jgi:chemotaxis protein MotB